MYLERGRKLEYSINERPLPVRYKPMYLERGRKRINSSSLTLFSSDINLCTSRGDGNGSVFARKYRNAMDINLYTSRGDGNPPKA